MIFGSVCSGIEAASVAWEPLGWKAAFFSEIEPFPCALLNHYYPDTPNLGDMTKFKNWNHYDIDVLVGGTPCQSFSVAGLRKGMDDPRGNLALTYLAIADKYRPRWLVWENVPGVLSSEEGWDFGSFLGGVAELGYGFSYRICDAQYWGIPQRRRRVFVVGHIGDWRRAAAVLFERHSLQGHPAPSRKTGQDVAGTIDACASRSRGAGINPRMITVGDSESNGDIARCLTTRPGMRNDAESDSFVVYGIQANIINRTEKSGGNGLGVSELSPTLTKGDRHAVCVGVEFGPSGGKFSDISPTLDARSKDGPIRNQVGGAVASFKGSAGSGAGISYADDVTPSLTCREQNTTLLHGAQIRRFTPRECERLQGFPDDWTLIPYRNKPAADAPRYKAIGNSMPVPVMRWIGERIALVDQIEAIERMEASK